METITSLKHLQHLQPHLQQQQQQTHEGLHATKLHTKRVATQPTFDEFKSTELQVPLSRLEYVEGFTFEFELRRRMVHEMGSFVKGSGDPLTQQVHQSLWRR
jgi:hypothetical protein